MGGWQVEMDINETGSGLWSRWLFIGGNNSDWRVRFTSKTHSSTPDPPVSFDLICFRNEIVSYQVIDDTAAASEVTPDNAITDPTSSPEEVGQGQ